LKITIITIGSSGDVQPFVALGMGLKQAGHNVTLCTSDRFKISIIERGLNYAEMTDDLIKIIDTDEGRAAIESGGNSFSLIKKVKPIIRRMLDEAWVAAQEAEVIIYHPKALGGYHIAEKLGIPAFMSLPLPLYTPTITFPNLMLPNFKLGGWFNKLTYKILPLLTAPYMDVVNQWRCEVLNLPPRSFLASELVRSNGQPVPVLYSYSKHVVPRPDDWPETTVATGYCFLDRIDNWQPPEDLVEFLVAGSPPVYVGFGSMAGRNPEKVTQIVFESLARSGQRGVIATGWGGLAVSDLPDNLFKIESIPHDWLFPQMVAVVHHGGAGTTAAGLRAGKPTVICPFFGDQPFWGRRVFELGVGPEPIPHKKLSVEKLANAIQVAVSDDDIRKRAAGLGEKIRAENGLARAVDFISDQLANWFLVSG